MSTNSKTNSQTTTQQHTPGPRTTRKHLTSACRDVVAADGLPVAYTSGFHIDPETEASNARLIAAAPDLLACAEDLVSVLNDCDTNGAYSGCFKRARAAITKATGGAQ
jgi:hypothetical protein